ncbi:MAG: hypothetical protein ACKV2T_03960 [Kofleriaceae bacterium]
MAKRVDNDSTQELSTSQLVPDQPDHDASVWGQVVVSPDQFSPHAPKASKPKAPERGVVPAPAARSGSSNRAALWIFLGFIAVAAIGGALVVIYAK